MCSDSTAWCVHVIRQWAQWPMCAWKCAVSQLSDSLHIYIHNSGHCTCTCTWCVHVNVHWSDCLMCSCKWRVSRVTEMCMKMCSEPSIWLSAHLHAHVRHSGHCTFTCTWCLHVNVQWSDCLMCSCNWEVSPMTDVCMKMCSEPIVLHSAHLHAHVRHTGHCTFTCTWCVHVNVQWFGCLMCSCNWAVSPIVDVRMKMCTEPFVWLSAHLHAHVGHTGHCMFTCNWCVHVNVHCLMCSIIGQWAQWPMCEWKCAVSQLSDSLHIYMHTSDTRVTARLHAPVVCM